MQKQDLALNNQQWSICHKNKQTNKQSTTDKNERKAAFSNKGHLEIIKNYRGMVITAVAAKFYNPLFLCRI